MSVLMEMFTDKNSVLTVHETDQFIAIMEPSPNAIGHVICFPKHEARDLFALEPQTYLALMDFCQTVARALRKVVPCRKIGMASIGLAVEHVHIHLVPINHPQDMNFMADHDKVDDSTTQRLAQEINAQISKTVM